MPEKRKIRLSYLIFTILLFSIGFLAFTYQQMPNYFKKDLISYDESTNAVVTNNLYRDIFPPRLRINSLTDEYQGWKEGPDWQHIPPLFLYVPIPFYYLDGHASIEVRRLSYVLVAYLMGVFFIIGIANIFKEKRAILIASIAAYLWTIPPFTRGALNGNYFGYSDIVLAFSVTVSLLLTICMYQKIRSKNILNGNLLAIAVLAATVPLMVKNLLGALPLAFLLMVVLYGKKQNKVSSQYVILSVTFPIILLLLYYGVNFWKSPEAFKASFGVSLQHFGDYEGWKKPWHYFITHYLPNRYLGFFFWPFIVGLFLSIFFLVKMRREKQQQALSFFLLYFLLNLVAISIVTSKSANFILQSYLFVLFFVLYILYDKLLAVIPALHFETSIEKAYRFRRSVGITAFTLFAIILAGNIYEMYKLRTSEYIYETEREQFYRFGKLADNILYANTKTLFILDTDQNTYADSLAFKDPDYWLRYYILFHSGSEARRLEEVRAFQEKFDVEKAIKEKYNKIYLVTNSALANSKYVDLPNEFELVGSYSTSLVYKKDIEKVLKML